MGLLVAMSLTLSELAVTELRHAQSQSSGYGAQLAAESGLAALSVLLHDADLGSGVSSDTVMANLTTTVGTLLASQSGMNGSVTESADIVNVPAIALSGSQSFEATLTLKQDSPMVVELRVTGRDGDAQRVVSMQYDVESGEGGSWPIFAYGIINVGPINVTGDSELYDLDTSYGRADVLTFSSGAGAINVQGSSEIGHAFLTADFDENLVDIGGTSRIGGVAIDYSMGYNKKPVLEDGCSFSQPEVEIPEIDTTQLAQLATSSYEDYRNSWGGIDWNQTFNNVRVPANTNPTFGYNHVINGIVYIEAPNRVIFNCPNINAIIVTESNRNYTIHPTKSRNSENYIEIGGASVMHGLAGAPQTPEFDAVRATNGVGILAPSFEVNMTNSGTMALEGGVIACDKLTVDGDAEGSELGTVIGLADFPMVIANSGRVYIQRSPDAEPPTGFVGGGAASAKLTIKAGSYRGACRMSLPAADNAVERRGFPIRRIVAAALCAALFSAGCTSGPAPPDRDQRAACGGTGDTGLGIGGLLGVSRGGADARHTETRPA